MDNRLKKRLFIALNLPVSVKDELTPLLKSLAEDIQPVKWTAPENLHLTLHFLGDLDEAEAEAVKIIMQNFTDKIGAIKLKLAEIGAFPNINNPRIIFIKCDQINGRTIYDLHKMLGLELENNNFIVDKRLWQAHLTLGRVKAGQYYERLEEIVFLKSEFLIDSLELMESVLTPSGPIYKRIISCKL